MDVDILRTIVLLFSFAVFVGIVGWAWSGRQRKRFDEAARLPFEDDEMQRRTLAARTREQRSDEPPEERIDG